jgi:polar amino acid transport system permease protein
VTETAATAVALQSGDWAFVASNADLLLEGTLITVKLTLASIVLGFLLGFPAGAIEVYGSGPLRSLVAAAGAVLRGTPILVIIVVLFFVVSISPDAFTVATVALGLRSGAYQSQIFRGAFQSVGEGQIEAARSVGMSYVQAITYVVVPQALRRSVPGFQNEFTIVLKDTSIAFAIGLAELLTRGFNLFTQSGRSTATLEVFLTISAIYFVLTFATNRSLDLLDDYYAIPGGENA